MTTMTTKRVVFIRHGCTYMNEYLSTPNCSFGCPNFTDIFPAELRDQYYLDSKLSPKGIQQAKSLAERLSTTTAIAKEDKDDDLTTTTIKDSINDYDDVDFSISDVDLFAVSPLTRAIQTYELGIVPALQSNNSSVPVIALPLATERLYLISDVGKPRSGLKQKYKNSGIDFDTGSLSDNNEQQQNILSEEEKGTTTMKEKWWFDASDNKSNDDNDSESYYKEWRPNDDNQRYACPGEPDEDFERRMRRLYQWISNRDESTIAIICHWGVIHWMLDADFQNCEYRIVNFNDIQPPTMYGTTNE